MHIARLSRALLFTRNMKAMPNFAYVVVEERNSQIYSSSSCFFAEALLLSVERSKRQSLHCMKWPLGYSNSLAPNRVNSNLLQSAFEGGLSTAGNACTN